MNNLKLGFAGRFTLSKGKLDAEGNVIPGSVKTVADWFDNLILDNGLNGLGAWTEGPMGRCHVGTGTTTPAVGQTALSNLLASTLNNSATINGNELASGYAYTRRTWRFNPGEADGNLTEVGVGPQTIGQGLFSRALIVDGTSTPTTVTVLPDEYLDVTYELRVYWLTGDVTGTISIAGVPTDFTLRASNVGAWDASFITSYSFSAPFNQNISARTGGTLGAITTGAGGTQVGSASDLLWLGTYSNNSFQRALRCTFPITSPTSPFDKIEFGNINWYGLWKAEFDVPVPKSGANSFRLDFLLTWARRSI